MALQTNNTDMLDSNKEEDNKEVFHTPPDQLHFNDEGGMFATLQASQAKLLVVEEDKLDEERKADEKKRERLLAALMKQN